jgi:hypothetical protein
MDTFSASIEWIRPDVGVARVHPGPDGQLGDPYVWCTTLDRNGEVVVFKGVCTPIPPSASRPLCDALYRAGLRFRQHYRLDGARLRAISRPIRPPRERPSSPQSSAD